MDVYSLINSKDIAEYLREIHYEFNSLETAWLIWKNDYLTFDEKKEKWLEVIETIPDCEVSEREGWHTGWESLHQMLEEYMNLVDEIREDFEKDPEPGKYVYQNSYYDEIEQYNRAREVFPDFRSCEEDAKEDNCRRRRAIQLGRYGIAAEKRGFFGHVCLWLSSYDGWVRLLSSANAE